MIIEKLEILCSENGTNLTALCKEITGSSGNLATWRKDRIRPDWLRAICLKFNISSDFLMDLPSSGANTPLTQEERDVLLRFSRLSSDYKIKAQAYMVDLWEKQENDKTLSDMMNEWADREDESVAAEEIPRKASGK